jgi:hypothetical protein
MNRYRRPLPWWVALAATAGLLVSCAIRPVIKDRHTVLEDEAAGEWPDFNRDAASHLEQAGPTPFAKVDDNAKKKRLYNVLNGELVPAEPVQKN